MKFKKYYFSIIISMIFILVSGLSFADEKRYKKAKKYKVTITNLTRGQIFSPPIVFAHDRNFSLFALGDLASEELAALAEDADLDGLIDLISEKDYPYDVAGGGIMPGDSVELELKISWRSRLGLISVAGMLVTTNDAFFAAHDVWLLGQRNVVVEAPAYDAGSEYNSENCEFIPGPPCGNHVHDDTVPEGFVHIHAGIHGIGDLDPAQHDWRNPVALIKIQRVYH